MTKLITFDDCESLGVDETHALYRRHVNAGQVEMISTFGFGRDLVDAAEGLSLTTRGGRDILDFTGGIGVLNHGHNHPRILDVRRRFQERRRMEVHKSYFSPYLAALSHNVAALLPQDLDVCYFPNSGAEAVEGAVKMAYRYHAGRRGCILHTDISYHGKLIGAASISGSRELNFRFPQMPGTHAFGYGDLDDLERRLRALRRPDGESDVYAVIVEPMSASSVRPCSADFLRGAARLCRELDVVLIFDEVFTGWGKTGALFHFMHHDVVPDILVTSKSLGGGKSSISGYVARGPVFRRAYGELPYALLHSTTYNGFGEEAATALEAINVLVDEDLVGRARRIGERLGAGLRGLGAKHPGAIAEVRGVGAHWGLLLRTGPDLLAALAGRLPSGMAGDERFLAKLLTAGVIAHLYDRHGVLTYYGENREILLMASPSLVARDDQVDRFLAALDEALARGPWRLAASFVGSTLFDRFLASVRRG